MLAMAAAPSYGLGLFGGGGFGGGGGLLGGAGGFGGGPRIGGGGGLLGGGGGPRIGGGAPLLRAPAISRPIARPSLPSAGRPVFGGPSISRPIAPAPSLGQPSIGGPSVSRPIAGPAPSIGRPAIGQLPAAPSRPILGGGPSVGTLPSPERPVLGGGPSVGGLPTVGNRPVLGGGPVIGQTPTLPGTVRPSQPVTADRLDQFLNRPPGANQPVAGQLPAPPADGKGPILGDRPIIDRPIMPNLGEKILAEEIRKEIVGRRIERAAHVRDRIRELYFRENHPFMHWWAHMWTKHPIWSWWRVTMPYRWANWGSVTSWCGYSGSYAQPVSYEYSDQGVYANGQEVQVDDEYSKQARELAKAGADLLQQKIDAQEADKLEWLPLGVFSLCDSKDGDPTIFLQLAISREGIIAGSYANTQTNENLALRGGADRESTRLAFTIGSNDDVVVETGLVNVTEEQTSAMIHYAGTRQNWILVRMADPQGKQEGAK